MAMKAKATAGRGLGMKNAEEAMMALAMMERMSVEGEDDVSMRLRGPLEAS